MCEVLKPNIAVTIFQQQGSDGISSHTLYIIMSVTIWTAHIMMSQTDNKGGISSMRHAHYRSPKQSKLIEFVHNPQCKLRLQPDKCHSSTTSFCIHLTGNWGKLAN